MACKTVRDRSVWVAMAAFVAVPPASAQQPVRRPAIGAAQAAIAAGACESLAAETLPYTPLNSIEYFERAQKAGDTSGFFRLFMVPGMCDCGNEPGAGKIGAILACIEQGKAPDVVLAGHKTNGVSDRSGPLCPQPPAAKYKGTGSADDAANFSCAQPARFS